MRKMETVRVALIVPLLASALSGCVAAAATGMVAGVSVLHEERSFGQVLDDTGLKAGIQEALQRHSANSFLNVSVTVIEGRVLLTGRVEDPDDRVAATKIAWSREGVLRVNNEIQVTDETGWLDRPNDIWIRTKVAASLLNEKSIKDVNYTVDTVNGIVYLMGVGQDQAE